MRRQTIAVTAMLAAMVGLASTAADARSRHHHDLVVGVRAERAAVVESAGARGAAEDGAYGGRFETGILGATTADPYERSAY